MDKPGDEEGATCGRAGCLGTITLRETDNCSCHISPPCSACMAPRLYCSDCDWDEADEPKPEPKPSIPRTQFEHEFWQKWQQEQEQLRNQPLDNTRVSWRDKPHTHFSMIKEGVYPQSGDRNADREMVLKEVNGTFGGRFTSFGDGKFTFIAYTD